MPVARDEELTDDSERGGRSREGFADADDKRNPIPPTEQGDPPHRTSESGRARDSELGKEYK